MHPNCGAGDFVHLLPFVRFVSFWRVFGLDRIYLTLDYEVVLHLLLPEVSEVRSVELLRLISDEPDVDVIGVGLQDFIWNRL